MDSTREGGGGMWRVERGWAGRLGGRGRKAEEERGTESGWRERGGRDKTFVCIDDTNVVLCPQELANWFIDCPRDRMKSAMSQLLIEILLPVAAVISLETTLPAVKKFVNILYTYCLEQAKKPRHVLVRDLRYPVHGLREQLCTHVCIIGCCSTTVYSSHACTYVYVCTYVCVPMHVYMYVQYVD